MVVSRRTERGRAIRIRERYGEAAFAEFAVVIAGSRIYPTVKGALMKMQVCEILRLDP